jgi:hypothetical protein
MRVEPHTDLDAQTFPPMGVQPQEIHQYDEPLATATADLPQSDACDADQSAETLNNRGTGHYTCAYGMSCTKGGVLSGQMVVFTRNSDIRYANSNPLFYSRLSFLSLGRTSKSIPDRTSAIFPTARLGKASPGRTS